MSSNIDKSNDEVLDTNIPPISRIDFDIEEFDYRYDGKNLSLNITTLGGHKDELENLLARLNFKFGIMD